MKYINSNINNIKYFKERRIGTMLDTKDVAKYLKISTQQVRRLVQEGSLPCYRISPRILRFRMEDVEKLLQVSKE